MAVSSTPARVASAPDHCRAESTPQNPSVGVRSPVIRGPVPTGRPATSAAEPAAAAAAAAEPAGADCQRRRHSSGGRSGRMPTAQPSGERARSRDLLRARRCACPPASPMRPSMRGRSAAALCSSCALACSTGAAPSSPSSRCVSICNESPRAPLDPLPPWPLTCVPIKRVADRRSRHSCCAAGVSGLMSITPPCRSRIRSRWSPTVRMRRMRGG
jgi:hypothetical protein